MSTRFRYRASTNRGEVVEGVSEAPSRDPRVAGCGVDVAHEEVVRAGSLSITKTPVVSENTASVVSPNSA